MYSFVLLMMGGGTAWWNPTAQTRPVLDHIFLCLRTHASPHICHNSASSVLAVRISCPPYSSVCVQKATRRLEMLVNIHNRLRYFLTNNIFLLQVMYRYVHMIFIVKCVIITRFFVACAALWWKSITFIVLSSLESIHYTVRYRYCIFYCCIISWVLG